jgi:hypothetical protein
VVWEDGAGDRASYPIHDLLPRMTRTTRAVAIAGMCVALQAAAAAQAPNELALTGQLASAGAPQLVLDRVSRLQPRERASAQWSEWESLRCGALAALSRYAELAERVAAISADTRAESLGVCFTNGARAALAVDRYADARRNAVRALWQATAPLAELQTMRLVVIDSYVGDRRGDEAYRAMLRYQQDHRPVPREVLARFVDALLTMRMDKEASTWLAQLDDTQPAKLRLRLRAGLVSRETAISQARAALEKGGDAGYWSVILDATSDADALPLRVAAYEQLLNRRDTADADTPGAARRLWEAYLAAAAGTANGARLLVGDDANWADYAGRRLGSEPAVSRALFAYLSQRAQTAAARQNAQLQLLHSYQADRLELVALRVFSTMFGDVDALDTQVRYRLGAMAEARQQSKLAARYWQDLPAPPDVDAGLWLLRVSRERWRAGDENTGADALARYYEGQSQLPPSAIQQGASYAEELAERGQHVAAQRLLESMLPHVQPAQSRPLLFAWGRARENAGQLPLAAEAYLRSALLAGGAQDSGAAHARMRAGAALARAGYARDARLQLEWVINNTKDAALVEAARRELKKLQL